MTKEDADYKSDGIVIDNNDLKFYYGKLFPVVDMVNWMSYGNDGRHPACDQSYLERREFSFTLDDYVFLRYLSFKNASELKEAIKNRCPSKIDIGAVYNVEFSKKYTHTQGDGSFTPVERELVFDIDISDYDDARNCCNNAKVCLKCWPLMTIAIKVIDTSLREDFGFKHILWVYSGHRGVHCWVCDGKARRLNNEQRAAIAGYFRVYMGNTNSNSNNSTLHPFLERSYLNVLKGFFEEKLLCSQQLLSNERYEKILEMIPDKCMQTDECILTDELIKMKLRLREMWLESSFSSGATDINVKPEVRRCVQKIVMYFTYPRLDMEVSKLMTHLLKAPFCVHPKTGRVCVPINANVCEEFDPTNVPTLTKLMEETNTVGVQAEGDKVWERTSLEKFIRYFRASFLQPLLKSCKEDIESLYRAKIQQSRNSSGW